VRIAQVSARVSLMASRMENLAAVSNIRAAPPPVGR
jgi:hypothetical protein